MTKINMKRIEELVQGHEPKTLEEELFVLACKIGISGETLKSLLWQISTQYDTMSHQEKDYMYLGYMLGQSMYEDANDETENAIDKYKKTTH